MIKPTIAIKVFYENVGRTEALITAMNKIKAYNSLYQMEQSRINPEFGKVAKEVQDRELTWIEASCAEHVIISLATAFETYYRELVQELLANCSEYILSYKRKNTQRIRELIESKDKVDWQRIEEVCNLRNRFDYYKFFKDYSIPFLTAEEKYLVEYIITKRNGLVHSGKLDEKTITKLKKIPPQVKEEAKRTEALRLRTKLSRMVVRLHKRVLSSVAGIRGSLGNVKIKSIPRTNRRGRGIVSSFCSGRG
jgi:hypothetical protein